MYTIRETGDLALVKDLHKKLFPDDVWVGDHHTFWVVRDSSYDPVGFASAVHRPDLGYVFLSRAGVDASARGAGMQKRLIRVRIAWAKKRGVRRIITYTSPKNYPSICSLLSTGFRFYTPKVPYVGKDWHYFELAL